jgi:hypothetical protein
MPCVRAQVRDGWSPPSILAMSVVSADVIAITSALDRDPVPLERLMGFTPDVAKLLAVVDLITVVNPTAVENVALSRLRSSGRQSRSYIRSMGICFHFHLQ